MTKQLLQFIFILEWSPVDSGCYRPLYYSNGSSLSTENNLIRRLEPVVLTVSEKAFEKRYPGYDNGSYLLASI